MTVIVNSSIDAVASIKSGDRIWCHSMAATPTILLEGLAQHVKTKENIELLQLHLDNAEAVASPSLKGHLRNRCFFVGKCMRELVNSGQADYVPMFLSEIPKLIRSGEQAIDVVIIQVSPPDIHGNCSLGVSVEATRAACDKASTVIAHVNPRMPRTLGDTTIAYHNLDIVLEASRELPQYPQAQLLQEEQQIGRQVSRLIEDGDCLQMGIGAIPDAALSFLGGHKNIGIHTEMFSDGVVELMEKGVITNTNKKMHRGRIVTGFVVGTQRVYDFVDDNPGVAFLDIEYVNNPNVIRKNPQTVSINSAIQVDLSGQVCADSIGSHIYSGVGGQVDFIMGASMSEKGRSIIALPSTALKGASSRIVATLSPGAGVVTTRAHVDYIVTEFGIAALRGRSLHERAKALIAIAHPDFREELERQAHALFSL